MQPRSVLFTLYGDYVRRYGGEASVGSLTRLLEEFGLSTPAVRAAIFRMTQQGWLSTRRVGRRSYYSLTRKGERRLEAGAQRIYKVRPESWDGRWRLLIYNIPEAFRRSRDDLRRELSWLGFGLLAPGAWISPWHLEDAARDLVELHGLQGHTAFFEAGLCGFGSAADLVRRCWDLDSIAAGYGAFLAAWEPRARDFRALLARGELPDNVCFRERINLVHEWRKFLFVDPKLPAELLPPDWAGDRAAQLFDGLYGMLSPRATRWFEAVFEAGGGASGPPRPPAPPRAPVTADGPSPR